MPSAGGGCNDEYPDWHYAGADLYYPHYWDYGQGPCNRYYTNLEWWFSLDKYPPASYGKHFGPKNLRAKTRRNEIGSESPTHPDYHDANGDSRTVDTNGPSATGLRDSSSESEFPSAAILLAALGIAWAINGIRKEARR